MDKIKTNDYDVPWEENKVSTEEASSDSKVEEIIEKVEPELEPEFDTNAERFNYLVNKHIKREGIEELMGWLCDGTDFYSAPASSKYHLACNGGLLTHSLHVFDRLLKLIVDEYGQEWQSVLDVSMESIAIIALFHDLSKVNTYILDTRNVKVGNEWTKVPFYRYDDSPAFLYGCHSENSVYLLNNFIITSHIENLCIRHHMGGKDSTDKTGADVYTTNVFNRYPLALLTHLADMEATFLDESLQ